MKHTLITPPSSAGHTTPNQSPVALSAAMSPSAPGTSGNQQSGRQNRRNSGAGAGNNSSNRSSRHSHGAEASSRRRRGSSGAQQEPQALAFDASDGPLVSASHYGEDGRSTYGEYNEHSEYSEYSQHGHYAGGDFCEDETATASLDTVWRDETATASLDTVWRDETATASLDTVWRDEIAGPNSQGQPGGAPSGQPERPEEDSASQDYQGSVTSSVRAHVFEDGRRYHAYRGTGDSTATIPGTSIGSGKLYALPNDETEKNRDDMRHALTLLMMHGELFYAPVHDLLAGGADVYDLGTGTGIWAIELADKYPQSVVRGVDLSPIQPDYVPDNVFFSVDDFEDEWVYPAAVFDYIHVRHSLFAVEDRPALLRRIFRHLKPGGFVEFQELQPVPLCDDHSLRDRSAYALRDFFRYVAAGMRHSPLLAGGSPDIFDDPRGALADTLHRELAAAGFVDVHSATHKCPLGAWPRSQRLRRCGLLLRTALLDGLRGWASRPLGTSADGLGWTSTQIEVFLVEVRRAVNDASRHVYFPMHVVYAQKPEAA